MLADTYPIQRLCPLLERAPSSYYFHSTKPDDTWMRDQIEPVAWAFPRYGYRRITQPLRRQGVVINPKRVQRILQELQNAG